MRPLKGNHISPGKVGIRVDQPEVKPVDTKAGQQADTREENINQDLMARASSPDHQKVVSEENNNKIDFPIMEREST